MWRIPNAAGPMNPEDSAGHWETRNQKSEARIHKPEHEKPFIEIYRQQRKLPSKNVIFNICVW